MAKTQTKTATVETAYGKPLPKPIKFSYEFEELEKGDEIPAKEYPDADDIRSYVNTKRNASARSAAQNIALNEAGVQKPDLKDAGFALETMVKAMVAQGIPEETARQNAKVLLNMA